MRKKKRKSCEKFVKLVAMTTVRGPNHIIIEWSCVKIRQLFKHTRIEIPTTSLFGVIYESRANIRPRSNHWFSSSKYNITSFFISQWWDSIHKTHQKEKCQTQICCLGFQILQQFLQSWNSRNWWQIVCGRADRPDTESCWRMVRSSPNQRRDCCCEQVFCFLKLEQKDLLPASLQVSLFIWLVLTSLLGWDNCCCFFWQNDGWIPVLGCIKCNEVALYPDLLGKMTSISAVCNQVCMQEQFQKTIHREKKRGGKILRRKLLYINTADSMQQAVLKMAEEKF